MKDPQPTIHEQVQEFYGGVAAAGSSCCAPSCCAEESSLASQLATQMGYSKGEQEAAPEGANLGLGCGNPQAIASLKAGETVLDLGSGAGFDSFLAAKQVGPQGQVIGVDMTPEMLTRARHNAAKADITNVPFKEGHIEDLPLDAQSVDVILSNCVINLSPDKAAVFQEAYRVLRPGGRLAISDIVAMQPIPQELQQEMALLVGCVGQAALVDELEGWMKDAGFRDISIEVKAGSRELIQQWFPNRGIEDIVASATIQAYK